MNEKKTKGTPETDQGLNEDNPNTERTPIDDTRRDIGVTGGVNQSNYTDEQEEEVPGKQNDDNLSRH